MTIVDDFFREAVDILVGRGISGNCAASRLSEFGRFRGLPLTIRTKARGHGERAGPMGQLSTVLRSAADSGRQTDPERVHRIVQRQAQRRKS
jgi:hypothetical protein